MSNGNDLYSSTRDGPNVLWPCNDRVNDTNVRGLAVTTKDTNMLWPSSDRTKDTRCQSYRSPHVTEMCVA
jgi:hypothetical protein